MGNMDQTVLGLCPSSSIREQKTMPLVNHAFASVTPAIFVIFVVFTGSEQQNPCLTG